MSNFTVPDTRLCSAVPYLKRGGRVIDVGTDHAYLPVYLVREGIASRALACDINRGPIERARAHIAAAGLSDLIETMQTDGLCGTEGFAPDDIMVFGMGGELIVRILSDAEWIKDLRIGLILQPMTRAHLLRRWLLENGFAITGESLTFEQKYYQTIAARFDPSGVGEPYTEEELLLGRLNIEARSPYLEGFVRHEIAVHEAILHGKAKSELADTCEETRILQFLRKRLEMIV
ncbi:MAG: SAM-dependent methyltransferase [Clostridia bacterium]|nr:SAM-dependent methyltransferase [Clostridia bacterium]